METHLLRTVLAAALGLLATLPVSLASQSSSTDAGEWLSTERLLVPRYQHTATRLADGRVVVAGGRGLRGAYLKSTEVFDPRTGRWTALGPLAQARYYHSATLLENGQVLVAGGINDSGHLNSVELFDPLEGTWRPAAPMLAPRREHTATLLLDGRVLLAGGQTGAGTPFDAAEIYDPSRDRWSAAAPMNVARRSGAAALLADGRVMVAGGAGTQDTLASSEIFDPRLDAWRQTAPLQFAREYPTISRLPSGEIVVIGGFGSTGPVGVSEIYLLEDARWTPGGALRTPRFDHRVALLPDDRLLVAGGVDAENRTLASAEMYDPVKRVFEPAALAGERRYGASATLLSNGTVLFAGGAGRFNAEAESWLATTELFASTPGYWQPASTAPDGGAIRFVDGTSAIVDRHPPEPSTRITFVDASGDRRDGPPPSIARTDYSATVVRSGLLVVAGGTDAAGRAMSSTEIYDPRLRRWHSAGEMTEPRTGHAAVALGDGRLLVSGGHDGSRPIRTSEILDPVTGTWSAAAPLGAGRLDHTMSVLPDGSVLVAGGYDSAPLASTELLDLRAGRWTPGAPLRQARARHTATLLPNGMVLLAGGRGPGDADLASTELYDAAARVWRAGPAMPGARSAHTATMTADGAVRVIGRDGRADEYVPFARRLIRTGRPQPEILQVPRMFPGLVGTVAGRHLTDRVERSGGGFQHSPAMMPTATLLSLVVDAQATISASPGKWSAPSIDIRIPETFPTGPALLTLSLGGTVFDTRVVHITR